MARHRDKLSGNPANWQLRCHVCNKLFGDLEQVQVAKDHWDEKHCGGSPRVDLKWIGFGPAPKTHPRLVV